jgi:hypothetical protein
MAGGEVEPEDAGELAQSRADLSIKLDAAALERLTAWIDRYRHIAEDRFRRLGTLLHAERHKT